jgi:heme-binding protein
MSPFLRGVLLGCVALGVVIQFYRPGRDNPPIDATRTLEAAAAVPVGVEQILVRSCNDCHSDQTHWPWYSNVAPISWMIADHVTNGRRHLNFSEWLRPGVDDPVEYTRQKFISACRELKLGRMPLMSYEVLHPEARLSSAEIQAFCDWGGGRASGR